MRPDRTIPLAVALLLVAAAARPSSESARQLAAEGRYDAARQSLIEMMAGDPPAAEQAEALALLGEIAVRQGEHAAAVEVWTELTERFPGTTEAWRAQAGLALVSELMACRGEALPVPAAVVAEAPPGVPPAPAPPAGPPVPIPAPMPADEPAAREPGIPESPTPRLVVPRAAMSGAVLVAGDGTPPEVIENVLGVFIADLRLHGVDAEMIPAEVWWRRPYKLAEPVLLETVRSSGAASLLYITMRFGFRERVEAACIDADGRELWREKVTGGSAYTDHRPHDDYSEEMVARIQKKLTQRIGGPCLPAK